MKRTVTVALVIATALALSGCVLFKRCPGSASCPVNPSDPHFAQTEAPAHGK